MRQKFWPLLIILVGLGLLFAYFLFLREPLKTTEHAQKTSTESLPLDGAGDDNLPVTNTPQTLSFQVTQTNEPAPSTPTQTPQPIFPTRDPTGSQPTTETTDGQAKVTLESVHDASPCSVQECLPRFGTSGRQDMIVAAHKAGLPFGAYLTWYTATSPPNLEGVQFWQLVNITDAGPVQSTAEIEEIVAANPGAVWIIGNEPDVAWQDNVPAARYAEIYGDVYAIIKGKDPAAQIAIAGVAQPTPMRLSYLDDVLDTYQALYDEPLPVDIWTIHAFILREEVDSWGVGIPPGMSQLKGELYEILDHNDIAIFRQNLIAFRAWMAERGYADKPLAVTEFGILHPSDFGFPPGVVAEFMVETFDFFMEAKNETGYPADEYRLVQWWFWYSVHDGGDFPTGNLYDPTLDGLTLAGKVFVAYLRGER